MRGPVRLVARDGAIVVAGLHRFLGAVELDPQGDGIVVSNRLSLERYLFGLAEVPASWPIEALRAQAVAARTYALYTLARPPAGDAAARGYDICATTDCQVFAGADALTTSAGRRWADAVRSTAGVAVTYRGAPILARYHSTSGGRTLSNAQGFPGERNLPYLRSVPSPFETAAPLWQWTTTFPLADVETIARRAGWWTSASPLRAVRTVPSARGLLYPDVVLEGGGARVRRTADDLQNVVIDLAPALFPGRYPGVDEDGNRLPVAVPSNRIEVSTSGATVRVDGRGFGHGVGMSQYGAHGMARRGASYVEILEHYYRGAVVEEVAAPRAIEVGVESGRRTVVASGAFSIVDGSGRTVVRDALGTWTFAWNGSGAVSIDPPRGFGLPLDVGIVRAPRVVGVGEPAYLTIALSRPARVGTVTPGSSIDDAAARVHDAGRRRIVWLAPVEPGRYRVRVHATVGATVRRSEPVAITVRAAPGDAPAPGSGAGGRAQDDGGGSAARVAVALAVAALVAVAVITVLGGVSGRMER
ncbi:MAG TPA: SpoIID/LytB domain-containing protein [Actinomycetota bacterium]|nr:SpoIID/LytB domain-containing protein [Actinomycetota bacterium]